MNILIVEPQQSMADAIASTLARLGYVPLFAASFKSLKIIPENSYHMMIVDAQSIGGDVPAFLERYTNVPIILMSSAGDVWEAKDAIKAGAADYLLKPFQQEDLSRAIQKALGLSKKAPVKSSNPDYLNPTEWPSIIENRDMQRTARVLNSICDSSVTCLISGESGTGKEIVARYIHDHSGHGKGPFVAINCAAIPENLLEAELFGHERGAFTGAVSNRVGKFEMARDGTMLLDEISEMDLALQAKLLRVLQEKEFYSVGGTSPIRLRARIIATTNRDLRRYVEEGKFRADLYYRLHVIPIHIPSLRERPKDVETLAQFFLDRQNMQSELRRRTFSSEAKECIATYPWPGNIRELENTVTRAFLLADNDEITVEDLGLVPVAAHGAPAAAMEPEVMNINDMERALILKALKIHDGNRTHAAQSLGISLRTLRNKINTYVSEGFSVPDAKGTDADQ